MALPEQLTRLLDSPFLLLARSREQRMSPGQRLWKSYAGPVLVLVGPVGLAALINSSLTREALVFTAFLAILALALRAAGATALCEGDADGSGHVSFVDVTSVLVNFGANYGGGSCASGSPPGRTPPKSLVTRWPSGSTTNEL